MTDKTKYTVKRIDSRHQPQPISSAEDESSAANSQSSSQDSEDSSKAVKSSSTDSEPSEEVQEYYRTYGRQIATSIIIKRLQVRDKEIEQERKSGNPRKRTKHPLEDYAGCLQDLWLDEEAMKLIDRWSPESWPNTRCGQMRRSICLWVWMHWFTLLSVIVTLAQWLALGMGIAVGWRDDNNWSWPTSLGLFGAFLVCVIVSSLIKWSFTHFLNICLNTLSSTLCGGIVGFGQTVYALKRSIEKKKLNRSKNPKSSDEGAADSEVHQSVSETNTLDPSPPLNPTGLPRDDSSTDGAPWTEANKPSQGGVRPVHQSVPETITLDPSPPLNPTGLPRDDSSTDEAPRTEANKPSQCDACLCKRSMPCEKDAYWAHGEPWIELRYHYPHYSGKRICGPPAIEMRFHYPQCQCPQFLGSDVSSGEIPYSESPQLPSISPPGDTLSNQDSWHWLLTCGIMLVVFIVLINSCRKR